MPSITKKNNLSLTLVELLLVTVMLAVISLAVFATFGNSLKIVSRVTQDIPEIDVNLALERFTGDVSNSLKFSGVAFQGSAEGLELVTLVQSPRLKIRSAGKVIYAYDANRGLLTREQQDFSNLYLRDNGSASEVLRNIKSLSFLYYSYNPIKKEYAWQGAWLEEGLPLAIRMELVLGDETVSGKFIKTVTVPIGG